MWPFNEITGFPLNNICIDHEKMALTKFGNMSIKSLLAPFADSFLNSLDYILWGGNALSQMAILS